MTKKEKIEYIITGILVVLLLLFSIRMVVRVSRAKKRRPATKKEASDSGIIQKEMAVATEKIVTKGKTLSWRHDPFGLAPSVREEKEAGPLKLEGVLWDKAAPLAIINGQILKKGENVDGRKIVEIGERHVILSDGEKKQKLQLE
jgi:hypothetical protein